MVITIEIKDLTVVDKFLTGLEQFKDDITILDISSDDEKFIETYKEQLLKFNSKLELSK